MSSLPKPLPRHFDQIRHDLEQTMFRLTNATDNEKFRRRLLKQLRLLLDEADSIIDSER